ncbi:hypothetical protein EDC19_2741 [Natranaerovirga hydrolytica]|uniref:Fibronectin type-III domain-containing protein n=1 Tax=Natranaerovirga hydrolytica TaxID=680378 RepID=A0A4R1M7Y2_9FIRM|nr:fibronectin type III domain-containing protein [Natranaerovirga hydrolytica]TCK87897.1 hypothetical protein EDC19_2741 [Natranaerovirga hydrolytica]
MKKIISYLLVIISVLTVINPININAIVSTPPISSVSVDEVYYALGQNYVNNTPILRPRIGISWNDMNNWNYDTNLEYESPFYEIIVDNITLNEQRTLRIDADASVDSLDIHDEMNLETGSLYEFSVQTRYYRRREVNGEMIREVAPLTEPRASAYAITDLNVELDPSDDAITVIWDDVGIADLDYRIVYAVGDYSNEAKETLLNNAQGEINNLISTSDSVEEFYDENARRNRLRYTIDQNIYPGQIYSIIVEPMQDYLGGELIQRNRNYPYIFTTSTNIDLRVSEVGNYVRLDWSIPDNFKVGQEENEYSLIEARIIEYSGGQSRNVAIFDGDAANVEYYQVPKPNREVEYQIEVTYGGTGLDPIIARSDRVPYVPAELMIRPTQPQVPKPLSRNIMDQLVNDYGTGNTLREKIEEEYLLPGDEFSGNRNQLLNSEDIFTYNQDNNSLQFVFTPFRRRDINEESDTYGDVIVDRDVYYNIYVAKNIEDLSSAIRVVDRKRYDQINENNIIRDDANEILGYREVLTQYFDSDEQGLQDIVPNQLYYIKVEALKDWGSRDVYSEPNIVAIYFDYEGNIYFPPSIVKPPLKVRDEETTQTTVTFEWKENWFEVFFMNNGEDEWHTEVWINSNGDISFEEEEGYTHLPIYDMQESTIRDRLLPLINDQDYFIREINLGEDPFGVSDVNYKFHRIPYSEVKNAINNRQNIDNEYDLNDYIIELLERDRDDIDPVEWREINPNRDEDLLDYTETGLNANTQYLLLLYPYRVDLNGGELLAHYPTPIIVITEPEEQDIHPDPTVPLLRLDNVTDISATIKWRYNTDLEYEIRYSEYEDIGNSEVLPIELPDEDDPLYPSNGSDYLQKVGDLFPNTEYYFWIRAIQSETNSISAWSNPLIVTTEDINKPLPPRGIGLASLDKLRPFGYEENRGEDFLTLEWLLDPEDNPEDYVDANVRKSFVYIVEIADNPRFVDPQYVELTEGNDDILPANVEKLERNLIKVNELIPNRRYYFRLKTRVILEGDNNQILTRESDDYSPTVSLLTIPSSGEYDGDPADSVIVLPSEYFETIYNPDKKELLYRFRYDGYDADGNFDHFIVERLIDSLIKDNAYVYDIDISEYENKPIINRKIEIPYRLWSAFNENDIDLYIDANATKINLPINSINSQMYNIGNQQGSQATVRINVKEDATSISRGQLSNATPVLIPQEISMQIETPQEIRDIQTVDIPLTLSFKTYNRYNVYNNPVEVVRWQQNQLNWQQEQVTYDNYRGELDLVTNDLGLYHSYLNLAPEVESEQTRHWAVPSRENVLSQVSINNIPTDLNENVSKEEYLNILYGLIEDNNSINVNDSLTNEQIQNLRYSRILKDENGFNHNISREETFDMTLSTFSFFQGRTFNPSNNTIELINESNDVNERYINNLALAIEQNFISNPNQIRPDDHLTYGEMFVILDRLLTLR